MLGYLRSLTGRLRASSAEREPGRLASNPALGIALGSNGQDSAPGRDVLADHRAGAAVGTVPHGDRRNEYCVGTCADTRADHRAVLLLAVVVGGDVAAADVGVLADFGVTGVAEVGQLGSAADGDVLGFVEGADLAGIAKHGAGPQVSERSDGGAGTDDRTGTVRAGHLGALADADIRQG